MDRPIFENYEKTPDYMKVRWFKSWIIDLLAVIKRKDLTIQELTQENEIFREDDKRNGAVIEQRRQLKQINKLYKSRTDDYERELAKRLSLQLSHKEACRAAWWQSKKDSGIVDTWSTGNIQDSFEKWYNVNYPQNTIIPVSIENEALRILSKDGQIQYANLEPFGKISWDLWKRGFENCWSYLNKF